MDLFLSRQEIRRRVLVATGFSSDALISAEETNRLNGLIDDAALEVAAQCRWLNTQRRATTYIDADEMVISYSGIELAYALKAKYPTLYHPGTYQSAADTWQPTDLATLPIMNVGPQGILEVAYWDALKYKYITCKNAHVQANLDQDRWSDLVAETQLKSIYNGDSPQETAAAVASMGALKDTNRGKPYSFECQADGLHFWPIADQRYVIRVLYNITASWMYHYQTLTPAQIDQIPSVCDALAITYRVATDIYGQQGDDFQVDRFNQKYSKRLGDLRARQATGEAIALDTEAAMDTDNGLEDRMLPRWDLGPIRP